MRGSFVPQEKCENSRTGYTKYHHFGLTFKNNIDNFKTQYSKQCGCISEWTCPLLECCIFHYFCFHLSLLMTVSLDVGHQIRPGSQKIYSGEKPQKVWWSEYVSMRPVGFMGSKVRHIPLMHLKVLWWQTCESSYRVWDLTITSRLWTLIVVLILVIGLD